jgi:hypothetical protein
MTKMLKPIAVALALVEARLLSVVRRFMPSSMVDKSLRSQFGLER